jgi:DMSO/TMAO reductase YedYZ heme-binding membrane subunit
MDENPEKKKLWKDFAGAFALTFFNEFNRIHHGKNLWQALFTAFFTALLLGMEAHITRGKKKQAQLRNFGLFAFIFAIVFLIERQRMGPGAEWITILSNSLTPAIWISAMLFLTSYLWRQAEGQTE